MFTAAVARARQLLWPCANHYTGLSPSSRIYITNTLRSLCKTVYIQYRKEFDTKLCLLKWYLNIELSSFCWRPMKQMKFWIWKLIMVIKPDTIFPKKFEPTTREARSPCWAQALTCSTSNFWKFGRARVWSVGWADWAPVGSMVAVVPRVEFNQGVSHQSSLRLSGWSLLNLEFCIL